MSENLVSQCISCGLRRPKHPDTPYSKGSLGSQEASFYTPLPSRSPSFQPSLGSAFDPQSEDTEAFDGFTPGPPPPEAFPLSLPEMG